MVYYKHGNVNVRTSEEKDIETLKNNLRQSDIQEIWASHRLSPEEALKLSLKQAETCMTIEIEGKPIGMFGITSGDLLSDTATIWMLATNGLNRVRKSFIKECKKFINSQLENYTTLEGYVDARNKISMRWLRWCGAKIAEAIPLGVDKLPFHYFNFTRGA